MEKVEEEEEEEQDDSGSDVEAGALDEASKHTVCIPPFDCLLRQEHSLEEMKIYLLYQS